LNLELNSYQKKIEKLTSFSALPSTENEEKRFARITSKQGATSPGLRAVKLGSFTIMIFSIAEAA